MHMEFYSSPQGAHRSRFKSSIYRSGFLTTTNFILKLHKKIKRSKLLINVSLLDGRTYGVQSLRWVLVLLVHRCLVPLLPLNNIACMKTVFGVVIMQTAKGLGFEYSTCKYYCQVSK